MDRSPDQAAEKTIAADTNIAMPHGPLKVCFMSQFCEKGCNEDIVTAKGPERGDDTGRWLSRRLKESGFSAGQYDVTYLNIAQGDALPDLDQFDSFVLGGSHHYVMRPGDEGRPWQKSLGEWLLRQRQTGKPLLGICGGHQAMAVAVGGCVTRCPGGVQAGNIPVKLTRAGLSHSLFGGLASESGDSPAFHFFHYEEVSRLPEDAVILETTEDSPAIAIDYGGGWRSVQFHPEASHSTFQHWVDEGIIRPPPSEMAYCPLASGRTLLANFLAKPA
jgi:GMP synthase-like glutamine amidotransferase